MRKQFLIGLFISSFLFCSTLIFCQEKKVLFLGNSYTFVNNLPEMVSNLASSMGDSVFFDNYTPGGYTLSDHATDPAALDKINSEDWDFVVIQAQSQEPSWSPGQLASAVLPFAEQLNNQIKANNSCTETVFFMTWGRKYGDEQNCASWPPVCTYLGMQERLMAGYMTMTQQNGSTVAPVGLAWKHAMDNDPDSLINLYSGDNSHPSLSGSYLTACVMYTTLFQKSPVSSEYYDGLSQVDAQYLQQIAQDLVLDENYEFTFYDTFTLTNYDLGWESWFNQGNISIPVFSYTANQFEYSFSDHSLNAETYLWNFGDGAASGLQNPTHVYDESGSFLVSLTTENPCFSNTAFQTLNVLTEISEVNPDHLLVVVPNPGNGIFNLTFHSNGGYKEIRYKVFDLNGKVIEKKRITGENQPGEHKLDLSTQGPGFYQLRIYFDEKVINKTLIIQ